MVGLSGGSAAARDAWKVYQEAESAMRQERSRIADQYHGMVMGALWDQRNKSHPTEQVRRHDYMRAGDGKAPVWSVGRWVPHTVVTQMHSPYEWKASVIVNLEFDGDYEPVGFWCLRGEYSDPFPRPEIRCGLTRKKLVRALKKLHP